MISCCHWISLLSEKFFLYIHSISSDWLGNQDILIIENRFKKICFIGIWLTNLRFFLSNFDVYDNIIVKWCYNITNWLVMKTLVNFLYKIWARTL